MTTTNHALTGACIASIVRQPILALPLAYASHFVCDAIPHFGIDMDFGSKAMYRWLVIDGLTAIGFAALLLHMGVDNPFFLTAAGFVAMSPDLAWLYYGLKGQHRARHTHDLISRIHSWIQWYQKVPGIVIEFAWATLMVTIIWAVQ